MCQAKIIPALPRYTGKPPKISHYLASGFKADDLHSTQPPSFFPLRTPHRLCSLVDYYVSTEKYLCGRIAPKRYMAKSNVFQPYISRICCILHPLLSPVAWIPQAYQVRDKTPLR